MKAEIRAVLKKLPAVDEALKDLEPALGPCPRWAMVQAIRDEIADLRTRIQAGEQADGVVALDAVKGRVTRLLAPSLRPVINATGVVLHTNLGRAPLGEEILKRITRIAAGYSNLEYRVEERSRGSRHVHAAELICQLTGAEDAVVVNNNAAAVLLCLTAMAKEREVVVSRGELIEIGGSFRLPDVMSASGAVLREVGTTNRTHPRDYEQAVCEETALLLKAHCSNYAVVGFTAEVSPAQLAEIGRARGVPTMFDLGSGSLIDLTTLGLPGETTIQEAVRCGFDLVTFSGDKLLGGPQAGIIAGAASAVDRARSHPLMRPLRPDKLTLAGLVATLEAYRDGRAEEQIPTLAKLNTPDRTLRRRAARLRTRLARQLPAPWSFDLIRVASRAGGGSLPQATLRSWGVTLECPPKKASEIEAGLRRAEPPVIGRIMDDRLILDVRTVDDHQIPEIAALASAVLSP